jgi:hypothetical protein
MPDKRPQGWIIAVRSPTALRSQLYATVAASLDHAMALVDDHLAVTNEKVEFERVLTDGEVARLELARSLADEPNSPHSWGRNHMRRCHRMGNARARNRRVLMEAAMYQYKESGLDNVWLKDGYHFHKTPYGRGISIQDTEGLHELIGQSLISAQRSLIGVVS